LARLKTVYYVYRLDVETGGIIRRPLNERHRYALYLLPQEKELVYWYKGFGLVRLGTIVDLDEAGITLGNKFGQGGCRDVHLLWKKAEDTYIHAVTEKGFPSKMTQETISARKARLKEDDMGNISVEIVEEAEKGVALPKEADEATSEPKPAQ